MNINDSLKNQSDSLKDSLENSLQVSADTITTIDEKTDETIEKYINRQLRYKHRSRTIRKVDAQNQMFEKSRIKLSRIMKRNTSTPTLMSRNKENDHCENLKSQSNFRQDLRNINDCVLYSGDFIKTNGQKNKPQYSYADWYETSFNKENIHQTHRQSFYSLNPNQLTKKGDDSNKENTYSQIQKLTTKNCKIIPDNINHGSWCNSNSLSFHTWTRSMQLKNTSNSVDMIYNPTSFVSVPEKSTKIKANRFSLDARLLLKKNVVFEEKKLPEHKSKPDHVGKNSKVDRVDMCYETDFLDRAIKYKSKSSGVCILDGNIKKKKQSIKTCKKFLRSKVLPKKEKITASNSTER